MTTGFDNRIREVLLEEKEPYETPDYLRSDWQELSEIGPQYEEAAESYDELINREYWLKKNNIWSDEELNNMMGWIHSQKSIESYNEIDDCPLVKPEQLNSLQRLVFEIVKEHHIEQKQLLLIVLGAAGSGKTFTIHAISSYLHGFIRRAAPTAKAAFLINGDTIHQMLSIRVNVGKSYIPLEGTQLKNLQNAFVGIKYVIIDEYSMLSQSMLFIIDQRLRQITQQVGKIFGGLSILLTGDPGQLLPVAATCLYDSSSLSLMNIGGYQLYRSFTNVVHLTQLMRQVDDGDEDQRKFIDLLPRLRNGDCTIDDFNHLRKRFYGPDKYQDFKDAKRIYALNKDCAEYNLHRIKDLGWPITLLEANNTSQAGKLCSSDQFRGLCNHIYLAIGANIVVTANIWKRAGITNGSKGRVVDIIYRNVSSVLPDLPDIIIIELEQYSGPPFFEECHRRNWVPFVAECVYNPRSNSSRVQFPFMLAYAITVHKAQGETLDKGVIAFGSTEKSLGSSYVQITRFKKFKQFCILPFDFDRISTKIKEHHSLKARMVEEAFLRNLFYNTMHYYQTYLPNEYIETHHPEALD